MIWFPSSESEFTLLKQDLIHKIKITFTCTLQQNYKTTSRPNPKSYLKTSQLALSEQKNAKRAHARSRIALASGTLAPLHRLPSQQLTLHFLIVAPFGANALQSSSLPQADFALHFLA